MLLNLTPESCLHLKRFFKKIKIKGLLSWSRTAKWSSLLHLFSSVQDGIMHPEKPMYTATPSLRSFLNIAFETVPKFIWLTKVHSCSFKEDRRALPLSTPLLQAIDSVMSLALCLQLASRAPQHFRSCKTPAICEDFPSLQHIQCSASTRVFEGGCLTLAAWASCSTFHYLASVSLVCISSWNFRSW